jgi:prepilin-type N-terminal cleavage/methylation domain-containing protein
VRRATTGDGFTFVEMLVVLFVLSLMTAMVVVNLDGITARSELSAAGRDLGNKMVFLRDLSLMHSSEYTLEVDLDGQRWRSYWNPTETDIPDEDERREAVEPDDLDWYELRRGITIEEIAFGRSDTETGDVVALTFSEKGELFPSGFVAYLRHESLGDDDGLSVEVSGLTGIVSYHRGRIEAEEVREENDF